MDLWKFKLFELRSRIPLLADSKLHTLIQRRVRACLPTALLPIMLPTTVPKLWIVVPNRTPATIRHFHIGRYRSRATLMDWTIWFPSLACIVSERSVAEMLCCKCPCIITRMHFGHISHWSQSNRPWEDFRGLGGHIFAALQPLYPVFNLKHSIFLETTLVRHIIISRRTN